jgi:ABC-type transporter Mla subunit MlaD
VSGRATFWLGLALGGILAGAGVFGLFWGPRGGLGVSGEPLVFSVVLEEAHGLGVGAPVQVAGLTAGEVRALGLVEVPTRGWRVVAEVVLFDGARLEPMVRVDSIVEVRRMGLLGDAGLAIVPGGHGESVRGQVVDAAGPRGVEGLVADLGHIATRLGDFLDGRRPGDPNLGRALKDLQETLASLRSVTERLN